MVEQNLDEKLVYLYQIYAIIDMYKDSMSHKHIVNKFVTIIIGGKQQKEITTAPSEVTPVLLRTPSRTCPLSRGSPMKLKFF
jgi:hypothetical protein